MDRMKTFKWYLIIFVSLFIAMYLLTYGMMIRPNRDLKYEIEFESPKLIITEAKSKYSSGYIKGEITNDTDEFINSKYLKIEFYNENGIYLGSKYKELKYFNVDETIKLDIEYGYKDIEYKYKDVESIKISLTE